jgi:hypothetical protein
VTRDGSSTRRGFLAVAGGTFLAGCGGLGDVAGGSDASISSYRLPDVTDDGESEPIVVETVPVEIDQEQLDERMRRVTDLLETVPVPLGPERIPNGVIRQRLLDAAADATTSSQDARTAQTRLSALHALRRARERARYAAAGWAYVEHDRTMETLQTERRRAVEDARSLQSDLEYLGRDLVRAALVYARLERNLQLVLTDRSPRIHESSPLLTVAEWGEHAESARALTDDTRYLSDRYSTGLPDDARPVKDALATAADTLAERLQNRRAALPPEPTEGDERFEWRLRYRLRDAADSSARRVTETVGPARGVVTAVEGFADFSAYERVRSRIADGETFRVESAADVHERRRQAVRAVRTALERSPRPELARPVLADAAATISYADEELDRYHGEVRAGRLDDPIRHYVTAAARARSVPTACRHVSETLNDQAL